MTLIDAPIPDEVPMSATTTRRAPLRRVIARSVALLAATAFTAACSDPTAPSALSTPNHANSVTTGVIIGSSSKAPLTNVTTSGVIVGSS
jgi:type IV secretory pathway protease TraF